MILTCDENHIYRNGSGIIVPNVTKILEQEGFVDFSKVPKYLMGPAQDFGHNVHTACELSDRGTVDHESLDPALMPYVGAWNGFLEDYEAEIVEIEKIVYSPIWNFCGRLDRVLKIKGKIGLYDLKTGTGCSLQTAAYKIAFEEEYPKMKIRERGSVKLGKDGNYKFTKHDDKSEESLWKAISVVRNSRKNYIKGA